jgi:hypothetical protein
MMGAVGFFRRKKAKEGRKNWIWIWRKVASDGLGMPRVRPKHLPKITNNH